MFLFACYPIIAMFNLCLIVGVGHCSIIKRVGYVDLFFDYFNLLVYCVESYFLLVHIQILSPFMEDFLSPALFLSLFFL
ncbi:hypothetical protein HanIR_Chr16g0800101 [Helianthus annuus]|nr:hypothetical protein HanIR_Chr16g0800101 [Helianthus annuus]